jgi:hypothetical protein
VRKINLKSKNLSANASNRQGPSGKISLLIGFLMLFLAGGLYGVVFYLNSSQAKKIKLVKSEIVAIKRSLDTNKNFKEVYDFQSRLLEIDKIIKEKVLQINVLNKISGATLGETTVKNLKVSVKDGISDLNVGLKVPDLDILSKQLESYNTVNPTKQAILKGGGMKNDVMEATINFSILKQQKELSGKELGGKDD